MVNGENSSVVAAFYTFGTLSRMYHLSECLVLQLCIYLCLIMFH